jgi:hypothetical protein
MASGTGFVEINFGSHPGSNEASVAVVGQTGITSDAFIEAWIMADDSTTDHTPSDHKYLPIFLSLTGGTIVVDSGFTIYGRSPEKLTGAFKVRWVWSV